MAGLFTKGVRDSELEILVSFFEGIILLNFFNIIVGIGALQCDVKKAIMEHPIIMPFCRYTVELKRSFTNAYAAFRGLYLMIAQFIFFKPLLATIDLLFVRYLHPTATLYLNISHFINKFFGTMVNLTSVTGVLFMITLIQKGHGFRDDFSPFKKFICLKAFFILLVCNDLAIVPALKLFHTPEFACLSISTINSYSNNRNNGTITALDNLRFEKACESRFIHLVVLIETLLFSLFLSHFFSRKDFKDQVFDLDSSEKMTGYGRIKLCWCSLLTISNSRVLLFLYSLSLRDVFFKYFHNVPLPIAKRLSKALSIARNVKEFQSSFVNNINDDEISKSPTTHREYQDYETKGEVEKDETKLEFNFKETNTSVVGDINRKEEIKSHDKI